MNIFDHIIDAIGSILSNKLRSTLSTLGIIIGITSVVVMVSIGEGFKQQIIKDLSTGSNVISVEKSYGGGGRGEANQNKTQKVAREVLTLENAKKIKEKVGNIKYSLPIISVSNTGNLSYKGRGGWADVKGVGQDFFEAKEYKLAGGSGINTKDIKEYEKKAVVGSDLVNRFFQKENPIGKKFVMGGNFYTVTGLLERTGNWDVDSSIFIPISTAQRRFGEVYPNKIEVLVDDIAKMERTKNDIRYFLFKISETNHPSSVKFRVRTNADALKQANEIIGKMQLFLGGIAGISLIVGGIGVMNIMLVSVTERTREIGIRKAIGASRSDILLQFLTESVILSLLGGIIAISLSYLISFGINSLIPDFSAVITTQILILATSVSTAMGVIFGLMPAWKAARLKPIDALRFE